MRLHPLFCYNYINLTRVNFFTAQFNSEIHGLLFAPPWRGEKEWRKDIFSMNYLFVLLNSTSLSQSNSSLKLLSLNGLLRTIRICTSVISCTYTSKRHMFFEKHVTLCTSVISRTYTSKRHMFFEKHVTFFIRSTDQP
jgi:hypothetical protein